jgi:hypothetical protein
VQAGGYVVIRAIREKAKRMVHGSNKLKLASLAGTSRCAR